MSSSILSRISRQIETIWSETNVWPEYAAIMQQALGTGQPDKALEDPDPTRWLSLPQLCCQAAGGDPLSADPVTAAWLLFHLAADIMDAVEDGDQPGVWWADKGPGFALNVASGLYFTASLLLNNLYKNEQMTLKRAREIIAETYQSFLRMSCGQHLDLTTSEPTLEQSWKIAAFKSGEFFAAGCRAGARLATDDQTLLKDYERFGYNLGLLIQILDDLDEIEALGQPLKKGRQASLFRSTAVAYALDVLPPAKQERLREILRRHSEQPDNAQEAWEIISGSGVGLYLRIEIERHRSLALEALYEARPFQSADVSLVSLVNKLVS